MSKTNLWRFKTKKEMSESLGLNANWNDEGYMDYLYGTYLPDDLTPFAEQGVSFEIPNTNKTIPQKKSWTVEPKHLMRESSMSGVKTPKSLTEELLEEDKPYNEGPVFDIDRLASEIDAVFQEQLKRDTDKLTKYAEAVTSNTLSDITNQAETKVQQYTEEVDKIFPSIKDRLIEEFRKGRTTIVLPDASEIVVDHMDHPKFEEVMHDLQLQKKAMLVGPAGTGKTYMVGQMAERLKLPFYKYSCSRDSSVHDMIGYKQPKSETYLETAFLKAYEEGGIFLVDEYDAMSGDMALFFNGVADSSKFISIPHRDTKPQAVKHKDFYLVMCGNTWGKGSTDYSGRDFQDLALMDRFRFCRHHIGYHVELERTLMGAHYYYAEKLRSCLEETGSYLSTRNIEDISHLIAAGINFESITDRVIQDLTEDEKKRVKLELAKATKSSTTGSPKVDDTVIYYRGNPIPLADLMSRYPSSDKVKLAALKKSQPKLYEEYRYALSGIGVTI